MGNHDFYVFLLKLHNTEQTDFIEIFMCCIVISKESFDTLKTLIRYL